MMARMVDISDRLENVRQARPNSVKKIAAYRASMWERFAERHEEKSPESGDSAAYCRETARQWREVAES